MAKTSTSGRTWLPFRLARWTARAAAVVSRRTGHGGSSLPGKVLSTLYPRALRRLVRERPDLEPVLVSATNGKTTLTAMLATIAAARTSDGTRSLVHNMTGANLRSGIVTTLMEAPRSTTLALLETDEATIPLVAPDIGPRMIVFGNLFRDQLDRYGELERLADAWQDTLQGLDPHRTTVVYNADDPLIASLVGAWIETVSEHSGRPPRTVAFGLDDPEAAAPRLPHAVDARFCRDCSGPLTWTRSWVGHLGDWSCTACGRRRPHLDVRATHVALDGLAAIDIEIELPPSTSATPVRARIRIPGLYNAYNAVGAAAAAAELGCTPLDIEQGLAAFSPAFGRFERVPVPGTGTLTLLLVKNPTGLNEVIRTLVGSGVDLSATLFALNDGIADGRDTSWIWDADVEPLIESTPTGLIATGDRAAEFALRAVYAGADPETVTVDEDVERALFTLLERARTFNTHGHAYALVTYTAMLRMRDVIARQGWADQFWERRDAHARDALAPADLDGTRGGPP